MKLYYTPGTCSLAPHIMLNELGMKHSLEKVDLGSKKTESGADYAGINGKGYVPALETGKDGLLTEASTILQYLADGNPASGLVPKFGDAKRYRAMEMLNFISAELHKSMGGLFNRTMSAESRKIFTDRLDKRLAWLDGLLARKPYLLGDDYSIADTYAFVILNWGNMVGYDLKKFANIAGFMARVASRPAVQAAMKAEGLA